MGVVAAITPCTNPIVTPMSNAMFALKCGNAIIITPHHSSIKCSTETVELINRELKKKIDGIKGCKTYRLARCIGFPVRMWRKLIRG